MVTVKEFLKRESKDGEEFNVLVLQGGVTPVRSKNTGKMYFTAKTCTVPTTFDDETCLQVIGQQFHGNIVKVECEPYEYAIPESGEVITLEHRWEYQDETIEELQENILEDAEVL